jgi:hypothetical protein
VRVKRARALARVGSACAPGLASVFIDSARVLMRNLALARDPVSMAEAAKAAARKSGRQAATALEDVAAAIEQESARRLNIEAARAGLKDLLALAQVWPEASHRQIRRGASRLARRARRARRRGISSPDPTRRHQWRKREKDRFFAAAILGEAWPGKRKRASSDKIGRRLGAERDALLLMEQLAARPELAGAPQAAARALKALNRRRVKFARRADKAGRRLSKQA